MEIFFIIITLFIAAIINLLSKRKVVIEVVSVVSSLISLVLSIVVALKVSSLGIYTPGSGRFFSIDSLGAIIVLVLGFVGFATTIYSVQYLRQEMQKSIIGFTRVKQYFVLLNMFFVAMFLAITSSNPIFAWISIEATTLSTAFLISFYNKPSAIEGAWKYLIINSVGLLLGFFGTLLFFTSIDLSSVGLVDWQTLTSNAIHLDPLLAKIAFVFVLIGYGTKIGFVPMHTWKPDAYSKAPAPIGALLSGALLPIAFVIMLRYKVIVDIAVGPLFSQTLLIVFGLLSIVVSALIMFNAKNYKRLLAYSSIENAGVMALGFGFGGLGIFAAILHIVYHSCVRVVLFLSTGNLLLKYSSAKIFNVKGALKVLPVTGVLSLIGFLIVTGVPPFGMFMTKLYILSAGMKEYPVVSLIALFFLALVFVSFLKHFTAMFFGEKPDNIEKGENNIWLFIPQILFVTIIVILSVYLPPFLQTLINNAVLQY
ncbi:MAG: proton-conducting transporter membrane subunit [Patescibacteria group bacterium]|nr:proton-conducting transporter membrane subunit [Patescibacteria group bacterium]